MWRMGLRKRMNKDGTVFSMIVENEPALNEQNLETLKKKLKQVMLLCRVFNKNVEIIYESEKEGLRKIITKVWLTTSKKVVMRDGVSIPAAQVREVRVL